MNAEPDFTGDDPFVDGSLFELPEAIRLLDPLPITLADRLDEPA